MKAAPPEEIASTAAGTVAPSASRRGPVRVHPVSRSERRGGGDRRRHSVHSFTYGSFNPRRRVGRRDGDHERVFLDWHEPRALYVALAILLMSCADALFTLILLGAGGEEMNVFMDLLLQHDTTRFLWAKIGVTAVGVVVLVVAARRAVLGGIRVMTLLQLVCAGYVLLVGYELWLLGWHVTGWAEETGTVIRHWLSIFR